MPRIRILAESSQDAALIAEAVGGLTPPKAKRSPGAARAECHVLGARHPISCGILDELRKIERATPRVPVVFVTDAEPEVARQLSDISVSAVVWFDDLRTELRFEIEAAVGSAPLLHLAQRFEKSALPPALRRVLTYSLRAAVDRPVRNVKDLAAAVSYSPITLSKEFSRWQGGKTTLSRFLSVLVIWRAKQLHSTGLSWKQVSAHLGFARETLQRKSKRCTGHTLTQLRDLPNDQVLAALIAEHLPWRSGGRRRNS